MEFMIFSTPNLLPKRIVFSLFGSTIVVMQLQKYRY